MVVLDPRVIVTSALGMILGTAYFLRRHPASTVGPKDRAPRQDEIRAHFEHDVMEAAGNEIRPPSSSSSREEGGEGKYERGPPQEAEEHQRVWGGPRGVYNEWDHDVLGMPYLGVKPLGEEERASRARKESR